MADKTKYSDNELQEFKEILVKKLTSAKSELEFYQTQLKKKGNDGSDNSDYKFNGLEDGAITRENEYLSQMASRQQKYVNNLENALVRIENGTYGICKDSGKLISKERLKAVPHATQSIEAKMAKK